MKAYNLELLMDKVYPEPNTGCWLWSGLVDKDGYGRVSPRKTGIRSAHRLSYLFHKGDFDRSLLVLHSCDNPICVNPDHLKLGTTTDNINDRHKKGRTACGKKHYKAKLTEYSVAQIKEMYKSGMFYKKELAKKFNVSNTLIGLIIKNKIWKTC